MTGVQTCALPIWGFAEDQGTVKTIREVYDRYDHCVDTHTAVGFNVYERYYARSGDTAKTVFVSTASPYKFAETVTDALFGEGYHKGRSWDTLMNELSDETGLEIPDTLSRLSSRAVLHPSKINKSEMKEKVRECLLKDK